MQNDVASLLARIDAVGAEAEPVAYVTEDGETVTAEAVTEAALNVAPQVITYDPVAGQVDSDAYERGELVPVPTVFDRQAEQQEAADWLLDERMANGMTTNEMGSDVHIDAHAGVESWQRHLEQRQREQAEKAHALDRMADVREFMASKIALPDAKRDHYLDILTLYVLHTYSFRASGLTPYLYVIARSRGAGKSQVGKLVHVMSKNPTKLLNPQVATPAVMADFFEEGMVTLFDETDKLTAGEAKEMSALLNLGNVKGGARYKMRGGKAGGRVEQALFAPKVVMGIARDGSLPFPEDTMSRGIVLEMETCSQDEKRRIGRFSANFTDYRGDAEITALREWMTGWSLLNDRAIRDDVPELPDLNGFRNGEVVEPLVTLADLLGGDWAARVRAALVALDTTAATPVDPTESFMDNVRAVLETYRADHPEARYIPTTDLYDAWKAVSEERLNSISFGKRIGSYDLQSKVTKIVGKSVRAYEIEALAELAA